jgi:hypothetical protein
MVSSQTKRTTKTKKWSSRSFLSFSLKGLQAEDFEAEEEHTSLCHQRFFRDNGCRRTQLLTHRRAPPFLDELYVSPDRELSEFILWGRTDIIVERRKFLEKFCFG